MARKMCVEFAESRMKVVARRVRYPVMIALSVSVIKIVAKGNVTDFDFSIVLVWGECTHVFHMHCLLKWIGTAASKQQCPMDRRTWGMWIRF